MCPQILYALEIAENLLTHTQTGTESPSPPPQKKNDENLKFDLKFSVCAPITSGIVGIFEIRLPKLTFHSDMRRRAASRLALPCPSSLFCILLMQHGSSLVQRGEADGASIVTPVVSDRSPLIKNATSPPPLIADATAFDNAAIAEPPQETTSATGQATSGVDRKVTDTPPEVGRNVTGSEATPKTRASNKKRKVLSIVSDARWLLRAFFLLDSETNNSC